MTSNFKFLAVAKIFIVVSLSFVFIVTTIRCSNQKGIKVKELKFKQLISNPLEEWSLNYERTIEYIKKHEGFANGEPYVCPGGYRTIGYGHIIKPNESFTRLTRKQADKLLRADFDKAIKLVERNTNLRGSKKLAIAHFVFTRGIGTFLKSPLKELVNNEKNIDKEIIKWCYYRNTSGKRIKSSHALNIRKWELKMYNNQL